MASTSMHAFRTTASRLGCGLGGRPRHAVTTVGSRFVGAARRPLSSTALRRATSVTMNPRKDDEGNDMHIEITASASKRLHEIMTKDANPALALRVSVQSGGCHGFQYLMSLANADEASKEEDTIFESAGAKVILDEASLDILKGSQVDFEQALIGSQFKIVGNPAATTECGCGISFDVKK